MSQEIAEFVESLEEEKITTNSVEIPHLTPVDLNVCHSPAVDEQTHLLIDVQKKRKRVLSNNSNGMRKRRDSTKMLFVTPPLRHDRNNEHLTPTGLEKTASLPIPRSAPTSAHWRKTVTDISITMSSIVIAVVFNLMVCIPFGLSFFPAEWSDIPVPRAVGIQMFLLTTVICQFVYTVTSSFHCAVGMMMVENVPFMHTLSLSIIHELGAKNPNTLPTILAVYALSTVFVGILFYVLGYFKIGSIVYLFPKHIIIGAIGGIGFFVFQSGIENATGIVFKWDLATLSKLCEPPLLWLWLSAFLLVVLLSVASRYIRSPIFPPLFFISIPILFYLILLIFGVDIALAHSNGWFFDRAPEVDFYLMWQNLKFSQVEWSVIPSQLGTLTGLSIFSLMHVPINIPSLSLTTGTQVDINHELKAHGISNTLGGLCGSVQNYLCYSTSALYYKCGGGTLGPRLSRFSGFAIGALTLVFFFLGPNLVSLVPRCMAGCLMIHIGLDLLKEALMDTYYGDLDRFEYGTVWAISLCMTFWGMNQGLALGAILACITFVMQSAPSGPMRGSMSGATLRSNTWRSANAQEILDNYSRRIHVIQLKGHLFFGNINRLSKFVDDLFRNNTCIEFLVLDFTLVLAIDSSAVDRLYKLKHLCDIWSCHLTFCTIPSNYDRVIQPFVAAFDAEENDGTRKYDFYIASDLNAAIEWCENGLLKKHADTSLDCFKKPFSEYDNDECRHLYQLHLLCPDQPLSVVNELLDYFTMEELEANSNVWKQGDRSTFALLVVDGSLRAVVEEEAGTTEDVSVGALVGELCLLTGEKRKTSMIAVERSVVYKLTKEKFEQMLQENSFLAFLFQSIALRYVSYRLQYVGNRIWETKCLPL